MRITSRMGTRLLLIAALLTIAPVSMALEQPTLPFEETVSCPTDDGFSEEIYIAGTYRIQERYIENRNHVSSSFQVFWRGEGYGLSSGAEYSLRGKWMEVIQESPPFIFLWNDHFQLTGKGQAENFRIYFKIRIVNNANGEPIVDFIDSRECVQI